MHFPRDGVLREDHSLCCDTMAPICIPPTPSHADAFDSPGTTRVGAGRLSVLDATTARAAVTLFEGLAPPAAVGVSGVSGEYQWNFGGYAWPVRDDITLPRVTALEARGDALDALTLHVDVAPELPELVMVGSRLSDSGATGRWPPSWTLSAYQGSTPPALRFTRRLPRLPMGFTLADARIDSRDVSVQLSAIRLAPRAAERTWGGGVRAPTRRVARGAF